MVWCDYICSMRLIKEFSEGLLYALMLINMGGNYEGVGRQPYLKGHD